MGRSTLLNVFSTVRLFDSNLDRVNNFDIIKTELCHHHEHIHVHITELQNFDCTIIKKYVSEYNQDKRSP